jgi:hypothetical protein
MSAIGGNPDVMRTQCPLLTLNGPPRHFKWTLSWWLVHVSFWPFSGPRSSSGGINFVVIDGIMGRFVGMLFRGAALRCFGGIGYPAHRLSLCERLRLLVLAMATNSVGFAAGLGVWLSVLSLLMIGHWRWLSQVSHRFV